MIPPVEVPAIRSTIVAIGRPVRASISASTSAGISPRMPPPSIASAFTGAQLTGVATSSSASASISPKREGSRAEPRITSSGEPSGSRRPLRMP